MNAVGWILVLLLFCVLILFVFVNKTPKELPPDPVPKDTEKPEYIPKSEPKPEVKPQPQFAERPDLSIGNYVSIYEYVPSQAVRRCPKCDGEYGYGSMRCNICGSDVTGR